MHIHLHTDADGQPDTSTLRWLVNGIDTGSRGPTLTNGFVGGDTVTCEVTPTDGVDQLAPLNVAIIIENTPPTATNVVINPVSAGVLDTLSCNYDFQDLDGEPDVSITEWFVNNSAVAVGPTLANRFVRGDVVSCTVTPYDGVGFGLTQASLETVIRNSLPTVNPVVVTPQPCALE